MASSRSLVDHLLGQMAGAGAVSARAMFGEYGLYCDGTLVAMVCDDRLFLKKTEVGREQLEPVEEASPYPGAKPCFVVPPELWDDAERLDTLVRATATELPPPAKSHRKRPRRGASTEDRAS